MKWFKHILILAGLLFAAVPCVHAEDHPDHDHQTMIVQESCLCHSCGDQPCAQDFEVEQNLVSCAVTIYLPHTAALCVFNEIRPVKQQARTPFSDALSALKSVRLLT